MIIVQLTFGSLQDAEVMQYEVVSSAFLVGNMMALVNDPTIDPTDEAQQFTREANCSPLEVQVGPW